MKYRTHLLYIYVPLFLLLTGIAPAQTLPAAVVRESTHMQVQLGDAGTASKRVPAGTKLEIIKDNGDTLEVRDSSGVTGSIARADVDIRKPDDQTASAPAQPVTREPQPEATQAMTSTTATTVTAQAGGGTGSTGYKDLNKALNLPLFASDNLWQEDAKVVACRIEFPMESETASQSSYRSYPGKEKRVLEARPYSMALYAEHNQPHYLSFVFANQGDFEGLGDLENKSDSQASKLVKNFSDAVKEDARTIEGALTRVLGNPDRQQFGTTSTMRESVARWNWNGHAFLLASPKNEYAALRIMPCETADAKGRASKISDNDLREILKQRVEHRSNGDVVVQEIPMVNQGPKGYCVPATWERYLRYLEMPADMYILAMTGNTNYGGGTNLEAIRENIQSYTQQYSRKIEKIDPNLDPKIIGKFIERGLPVMWACFVDKAGIEKNVTQRSLTRKQTTDWESYIKSLDPVKKEMRNKRFNERNTGHLRMIIGYNSKTGELAISDSWGAWAAERWMTAEEAEACSQGDLTIIKW